MKSTGKKLAALLLAVVLVGGAVSLMASAATNYVAGRCGDNATWMLDLDTWVLSITGTGEMWDGANSWYSVGNEFGVVTYHADSPFEAMNKEEQKQVKAVVVSEGITKISDFAFPYYSGIESVVLPDSLISIGAFAFYQCTSLADITLPANLQDIGGRAFEGCSNLTDIEVPSRVTNLRMNTFAYSGLQNIFIPCNVQYFSYLYTIFEGCSPALTIQCYEGSEAADRAILLGINYEYVPHNRYESIKSYVPYTCTENGIRTYQCIGCGITTRTEVVPFQHTPQTVTVPATCTANGASHDECAICNANLGNSKIIPATGHTPKTAIDQAATCTTTGASHDECVVCNANLGNVKTIPATVHNPGAAWETTLQPTSLASGERARKCITCQTVAIRAPISPTGNSKGDIGTANWDFIEPVFHSKEIPSGYTAITTPQELSDIRNDLNGNYILMNDIDLSAWGNWQPIGEDNRAMKDIGTEAQIIAFRGKLDGNGYVIKNLTVNISTEGAGLFSYVSGCEIKNLGMVGSSISGDALTGGIVGKNVAVNNKKSIIINCFNKGSVFSRGDAGGIIGDAAAVDITKCYNTGRVESASANAGGIVGGVYYNGSPFVKMSFNTGAISADSAAGGILGCTYNQFEFTNCYNAGTITGYTAGGITGSQAMPGNGLIRTSYNSGNVNGSSNAGGIIGFCVLPLRLDNCYYLNSASKAIGSYATGSSYTPPTARLLTAPQMALQSSFGGFDFEKIWRMGTDNNYSYPVFQKEEVIPPAVLPKLSLPSTLPLNYKQAYTFNNEGHTYIKWSSSNPQILSVDESTGKVTHHKKGETIITAKANGTIIAQCKVTVKWTFWQWLAAIFLFGWIWL